MKQLRILYSSNAFWSTSGYGVQGRSLLPRLRNLGCVEDVAMFAWYGLEGGVMKIDNMTVYPKSGVEPYGNDIIQAHAKHFNANLVITLIDAWVLNNISEKIKPALFAPWFPIDHDPIPECIFNGIKGCKTPLTYSRWADSLLKEQGITNSIYIPHGYERKNFFSEFINKAEYRRYLEFPEDCFLVGSIAANKGSPSRKSFSIWLRAFASFASKHQEARLYLHTEPTSIHGGEDLIALCKHLGIEDKVRFADRYQLMLGYSSHHMRKVYNSLDVHCLPSMAEGFGIPTIESMACGIPNIVTDFSAQPELIGRWPGIRGNVPPHRNGPVKDFGGESDTGYITKVADWYWSPLNAWQAWPDVKDIELGMEWAYSQTYLKNKVRQIKPELSTSCQLFATPYDWDNVVAKHWYPFLTSLSEELDD